MECTQQLEYTQDLYGDRTERVCQEQIGFLGICGTKHAVKRGPNKIGRDPLACNIVLNLNSISRQHAVINIISHKEYMIMDLDSANKTKVMNIILQPYIPHPLKNGDTVQFGDVFGIFRLLEDEDDLPMTQVLDIPDTPVRFPQATLLNKVSKTTVPESPDVSDRDDSFIAPSQTEKNKLLNNNLNFVKPANKIISIQPIGTNKVDNIYWKSANKSRSLSLNSNNSSLDKSLLDPKEFNIHKEIHEMETQPSDTVIQNEPMESIYDAETQIPQSTSFSIHNLNTQILNLPKVEKISNQHDMQLDLNVSDKENENSIYNAETQQFAFKKPSLIENVLHENSKVQQSSENSKINIPNEVLLFDGRDSPPLLDEFDSQPLLASDCIPIAATEKIDDIIKGDNLSSKEKRVNITSDNFTDCEDELLPPNRDAPENDSEQIIFKGISRRVNRILSDSFTNCDDISVLPTQKVHVKNNNDDDLTDCEEELDNNKQSDKINQKDITKVTTEHEEKVTNIDEVQTQILEYITTDDSSSKNEVLFEDMLTQVIGEMPISKASGEEIKLEEIPTQVVVETNPVSPATALSLICVDQYSEELVSPFKIPLKSPKRNKKKDISISKFAIEAQENENVAEDDKYYKLTQDIYEDLCTQVISPEHVNPSNEELPSSTKNHTDGQINHNKQLLPRETLFTNTPCSSDGEDRVNKYVSGLSTQEIENVVGAQMHKKKTSESSDVDVTPKKIKTQRFLDIDLPDSQEIKTSISLKTQTAATETSESETECSEDFSPPIVFRPKKKLKIDAKKDLTISFNVDTLPTRLMLRNRKPTTKLLDNLEGKQLSISNLGQTCLESSIDGVDKDIINENITRLKSKSDKVKESKGIKKQVAENKNKNIKEQVTESKGKACDTVKQKKDVQKESKNTKKDHNASGSSADVNNKSNKDLRKVKQDSSKHNDKEKKEVSLDAPSKSNSSTSSTRSTRQKKRDTDKTNKSLSPVRSTYHRTRSKKTEKTPNCCSPEKNVEVRRSRRQRTIKEKKDIEPVKITRSILKRSIPDESLVYNMSSDSSKGSPSSLKRPASDDVDAGNSKRNKVVNNGSTLTASMSGAQTQYVLFTALSNENVKLQLENLGAVIVTDVKKCTVVVTMQIKRTFKMLCAIGLGKPIVGLDWVQACVDAERFVDPWLHIMKDEVVEKRFKFSLKETLTGKRNFLKGYNVSATPNVIPCASEMKLIVECSGGSWRESSSRWICVSCTKDREHWQDISKRGASIVTSELILRGVLTQNLDIQGNLLRL